MSEKDIGNALLQLSAMELAGASPLQLMTARVLERDRRRVRWLTGLTFAIWMFAGLLALAGLVSYGFTFPLQENVKQRVDAGKLTPAERDDLQVLILKAFMKGTTLLALSVVLMAVGAMCTVVLILALRRATLRQVNANLVQLSDQLRGLQSPAPPKGAAGNNP